MKLEQRIRDSDLNGMFSQKINYDKHKKKLEELANRKSYLIKSDRVNKLEALKVRKHNNFLKELVDRNQVIGKDNTKLLERLTHIKECIPQPEATPKEQTSYNPFRRRQLMNASQENARLSHRLKSLVSSINTKKIELDYERNSQIRSRISRYQSTENSFKRLPKSQKFINLSMSKSIKSMKSAKHVKVDDIKKDSSTVAPTNITRVKPLRSRMITNNVLTTSVDETKLTGHVHHPTEEKPKSIGSFYNKEDIVRNRISCNNTVFSSRQRSNLRTRTQRLVQRSRSKSQDHNQKSSNFFPTELPNNKPKNSAQR